MLLFRPSIFRAGKFSFAALILVIGSFLNACGYTPLFEQRDSTDLSINKKMALVQIQPIKDRIGQRLRSNLLVRLNPRGKPVNPLYTLNVVLEETSSKLNIKKSTVVTRGNLRVSATFTLSKISNITSKIESKNLLSTKVTTISSYDIPQAQYAALANLKDAQTRALREIADNIRIRIGIYFHQNSR